MIAAVHGNCFGGGLQIALGADLRIAAPDARLSVMEVKWGLVPDMAITRTLPRLVRLDVAKELTYTGRVFSGTEAAALGLVTRIADDPLGAARELAAEIAARSPDAVRAAKRLYDETWTGRQQPRAWPSRPSSSSGCSARPTSWPRSPPGSPRSRRIRRSVAIRHERCSHVAGRNPPAQAILCGHCRGRLMARRQPLELVIKVRVLARQLLALRAEPPLTASSRSVRQISQLADRGRRRLAGGDQPPGELQVLGAPDRQGAGQTAVVEVEDA